MLAGSRGSAWVSMLVVGAMVGGGEGWASSGGAAHVRRIREATRSITIERQVLHFTHSASTFRSMELGQRFRKNHS